MSGLLSGPPRVAGFWTDLNADDAFGNGSGEVYTSVDPATGDAFAFTVQLVEDRLLVCVAGTSDDPATCDASLDLADLPLMTVELNGQRFVLAFVERARAQGSALRVKLAEGTWTLPLADLGPRIPGWAVATLLPTNYGVIQLVVDGEIVAAI